MGQLGFFDADRRLAALSEKGDPLEAITALVPWESFRAEIEAVVLTPDEAKKSKAGRKPFDAIMMFRMLVLQSLYNLSDVQIEYQVWDRATFTRFVGLGSEDCIPDGTTLWLFREKLARAGLIETLFDRFDQHLTAKGYIARGGQMVDASIVPMPKQRNTREENAAVKRGETPAEGKHVISEKPFTTSVADAEAVIAACRDAKVKLSIGYRLHFHPYYNELMRLTREKEFGTFTSARGEHAYQKNKSAGWRLGKALGGGPLRDLGIYVIQAACMAAGDVASVSITAQQGPTTRPKLFVDVENLWLGP